MLKAVIFDFGHTIVDELELGSGRVMLMPGVEEALPGISLSMGIWANSALKEPGLRELLRRAKIDHYFSWVVTSAEAGHRKPDRRFFDYALKKCGLQKREVLFVGNQLNTDIKGAADYGIESIWLSGSAFESPDDTFARGQVDPTYTIESFKELPELLVRLKLR